MAVHVIWQGGNPWRHYLLFLLHPVTLIAGLLLHRALGSNVAGSISKYSAALTISAVLVFVVWTLGHLRTWNPVEGSVLKTMRASVDPVSQLILSLTGDDRHFAIWGCMPRYYVKTGLYPSTRDTVTQLRIQTTPLKAHYIERYLEDFRAARLNVFVEATGDGNFNVYWNANASHSAVPELASIIQEDFVLVYHCGTPETRIYVRKSHLQEFGKRGISPVEKKLCLD